MDTGRRVPVFIRGRKRPIGTVIAPINSPGPLMETVEVGGITATYWRNFDIQVFKIEFESLSGALRWPSFEPLGGLKE
jgi:hypothetical protein